MCQDKLFIVKLFLITIYSIFAQDPNSNKPANSTLSQNLTIKPDSNITWIRISPITSNISTDTPFETTSTNCTISENSSSNESQNLDVASSLRRKRRKRRRNKYKSWNQRTPEHSYKKHSTKVQLNKPVQFLVPPDYQENLIPKESSYYKSRNDVVEKFTSQTGKKIPPPVRHLLPPLVDTRFSNLIDSVPPTSTAPVQKDAKTSKQIDWSPNSTNRGSTKFKHTIYYSDSGNEIISNYEITSTTPTSRVKYTTTGNDERAFISSRTPYENPKNSNKLEHRPIVVQSAPNQYTTPIPINNHTISYPNRDTRILNSLVSFEVANAGMQVINMSTYQIPRNQFVPSDNFKQLESPSVSRFAQSQRTPPQQSTPQSINYQQYQPVQETAHQVNHQQLQSQSRIPQQINNQHAHPQQLNHQQLQPTTDRSLQQINYQQAHSQQQNDQQSQPPDRIPQQVNYQQPKSQKQNYQQSPSQDRIPQQLNYQQAQPQQQNYQQSPSQDRIPQQLNYQQAQPQQQNYQQSPSQDRIPQQLNYQQVQPQQQNYQQVQPQQQNYQQSQTTDHIPQQINSQQSSFSDQPSQQINYQQSSSQHQHKTNQNQHSSLIQSQPQQTSRLSDYSRYEQTQSSLPNTASSHPRNFQAEFQQPYQTYNQQSLQNYQQTTYSRTSEPPATTPTPRLISNRTSPQIDKTEDFKGLDLAESKYFSDIPSEQEFNAVQNDNQVIPGIAGKDYPVFDQFLLQKRRFACRGLEGYFADVASRCQVFYICNGDGAGEPMLCPNGTLFSQELLVCDWWYNVDC